jgi:lysophospholipase L1-like esterase
VRPAARRVAALLLGLSFAGGVVGAGELRQRGREAGRFVLVDDLKYAAVADPGVAGTGWVEGREAPARHRGMRRVLCVGDSVTEGAGVGPALAWPGQLGELLGTDRVEVQNFGVNGWDASQVATLIDTRLAAWDPDLVIWGTYANDIFPTYAVVASGSGDHVFVGTEVPHGAELVPGWLSTLLLPRSALFRHLQAAAYLRMMDGGTAPPLDAAWYVTQVERIEAWSASRRIPVLMVAIPPHILAGPCTAGDFCERGAVWHGVVVDALRAHATHWIDALGAWAGRGPFYLPGRTDPDHPNADGHALLARLVAPAAAALLPARGAPAEPEDR